MKSRKTKMFVALGLAAICGFLLMTFSYASETKNIELNIKNAIQTIPVIHFRSDLGDKSIFVELTNVRDLVRINTKEYNFVLKKGNSEASGKRSTILGGVSNKVNGSYSTIIAGNGNKVTDSYGTIGGGQSNEVDGEYGTVAGGQLNVANSNSTVVGGKENEANGTYSVALGNNANANGNNSVAMGKDATVSQNNSFLWNDGTSSQTLNSDNTFAVVGSNGMVVNKNKAHRFAQLTIGGSLIIATSTDDKNVECTNGKGKGIVKVVAGSHSQACFCSCNGSNRSSLYGGGDCSFKCTSITPKCDNNNLIKFCDTDPYTYSGHCLPGRGEVVEGYGAYMVDKDGLVHWTCQTNDGQTDSCVGSVTSTVGGTNGQCAEPDIPGRCSGGYDSETTEFLAGSNEGFTGVKNATLYASRSEALGHYCAYFCKDGYYKKGELCAPMEGCKGYEEGSRQVPYLNHGETKTITNNAGTCTRTATCYNGETTLGATRCCQGSYPSGATPSSVGPTSNKNWFCATNTSQACSYTCPSGKQCNASNTNCVDAPISCPAGQYLPKNSTTCSQCPCGYYCPGGSWTKSTTADQGKNECGAGKWSSPGSISCSNISCGYYGTNACSATPARCESGKYSAAGASSCSSCPANQEPDGYQCSCQPIQSVGYCGTSVNSCTLGGQASNPDDTNPSKNTWDCPQETGCYKCKDGYTDKGNGVCEEQACSVNVKFNVENRDSGAGDIYVRDIDIRGSGRDPDGSCDLANVMGTEVTKVGYNSSYVFNCNFNFNSEQSYEASLVLASGLPGDPYYATYNIGNWKSFTPRCGDNTVTLNVNSQSLTYYITPSYATRSDFGEVDLDVKVNGSNADLPADLGLLIYWRGHDGQSPAYGSFAAPGSVSHDSAGIYRGYVGYPIASVQGTHVFTAYDFGFDSSYSKQTTINGDTYIMNWTSSEVPQCGSAHGTNRASAPSTADERCSNGSLTPGSMTPSDIGWNWTCTKNGVTSNPCEAWKYPECGTDYGKSVSKMPTGIAACNPGNRAIPRTGDNQFTWDCGLGLETVSCYANRILDGKCAVTDYDCEVESSIDILDMQNWYHRWICNGINGGNPSDICTLDRCAHEGGYRSNQECEEAAGPGVECYTDDSICWFSRTPVTYSCNAGEYLSKNSTSCSQCPCGYYCPGGQFPKSTTTDQGKYKCDSGKYSAAGAGSCNSCSSGQQPNSTQCSCEDIKYTCSAGQYLPKNATTCSQCPCGSYCPGGQFLKSTTTDQGKYECGDGKWSSAGATSSSSCGNISCGYYGKNACSATPARCESGKYSAAGASSCSSCPANQEPDGYQCSCQPIQSVGYCGTSVNSCTLGGQASNPDDTNPAKNTWDCPQETGCYKCKDGYVDKGNGVCQQEPITINICPKAVINSAQSAWGADACYHGEVLNSLSYESSQALPTKVKITTTFNYYSLDERLSCYYKLTNKTNEYTIMTGNTESDPIKVNQDALRLASMWNFTIGYSSYFDPSFVQFVRPEIYKDSSGKQYEFVISNDCEPTSVEPAKCGQAHEGTYTTSPNASLLCKKGEYSIPQKVDGKWTWTCTNGNSVAECRANVGSSQTLQCGTQKWTCIGGDVANKQGSKWNCVNGTESICCSYVCTPKKYSCPSGYRLTSDNKCELYMQFCVNDICGTNAMNAHLCSNGDSSNCGSETCFGDASQAANGAYCDWGRGTIEYSYEMTSQYGQYTNSTFVGWGMGPSGNAWGYAIRSYNSKTQEKTCTSSNYYSTEQILRMCPTLKPVGQYNGKYDNGFYIDSETCTGVPEFDACEEGGECTVNKVANSLCGGGVIDPPSTYVCTDACDQCYDTFGECMANKPGSATSNCVLGTPNSALESQCYCYRPAATVPVCWFS